MDSLRQRLLDRLNIKFSDTTLLEQSLTHRSVRAKNNERLEFLGDAVIELIVSQWLYQAIPDVPEGLLTRYRATFVCRESLAQLARTIELGETLALGAGELKSGGRQRDSILADGFEALFGAIFLDQGLETCRQCLLPMLTPRLSQVRESAPKDPKTRLQEYLQSRAMPTPEYLVIATQGAAHEQEFLVECQASALNITAQGSGTSRRRAEQSAAQKLLDGLEDVHA